MELAQGLGDKNEEKLDLREILKAQVADFHRQGLDVRLARGGECFYQGDPLALNRILTNLLDNAAHYGDGNPVDVDLSIPYEDKFFHCLAYFVLMAWFAQIYHHSLQRNIIALGFVIMGVALEYLQSFDPARMSEFADMMANSTGVILGLMLALTKAKYTLVNFEQWIR